MAGSEAANSINSANLANNFDTDSDGLIYYNKTTATPNVKVYDLTTSGSFKTSVSSSAPINPTSLTDHALSLIHI